MCSRPEILLEPFAAAGADEIIVMWNWANRWRR